MKKSLRTTVCCVACTLLAASAWAQREPGSSSSSSSSQSPSSSSPSSQGGLGGQSGRSSASSSSMGQQSLRVSQQVINAQVKTQDGQQLGQIEDLIANPQTGKIEFAVVSKGDKLCPIPMQLLQPQGGSSQGGSSTSTSGTTSGTSSTSSDPSSTSGTSGTSSTSPFGRSSSSSQRVTFVAQIDKSKIDQAPSFSRTQWPEMSSTWSQQVYSHYGVTPEAAGSSGSSGSSYHGKSSSGSSGSLGGSSTSGSSSSGSSSKDKSSSSSDTQKKSNQKSEN